MRTQIPGEHLTATNISNDVLRIVVSDDWWWRINLGLGGMCSEDNLKNIFVIIFVFRPKFNWKVSGQNCIPMVIDPLIAFDPGWPKCMLTNINKILI